MFYLNSVAVTVVIAAARGLELPGSLDLRRTSKLLLVMEALDVVLANKTALGTRCRPTSASPAPIPSHHIAVSLIMSITCHQALQQQS